MSPTIKVALSPFLLGGTRIPDSSQPPTLFAKNIFAKAKVHKRVLEGVAAWCFTSESNKNGGTCGSLSDPHTWERIHVIHTGLPPNGKFFRKIIGFLKVVPLKRDGICDVSSLEALRIRFNSFS